MERTEQMYTIQKQMDFGKIKVRADHYASAQTPSRKNTLSIEFTEFEFDFLCPHSHFLWCHHHGG